MSSSEEKVIAFAGKEARKKKKVGGKSFLPTFWDEVDTIALKAYETLFVDDLSSLMAKSSSKVMSSHIQKLVQALGESLFILGRLLNLEKKVATSEPLVKSLSAENEMLKNKDFKDSDEYSDDLCKYYMEGFDLLVKWMAKHHPSLDLSDLAMDDVEKELMSDRPFEDTVENVTKGATDVVEVMEKAIITIPADPVPDEQ
nr:hypothetical protein CFP56_31283 [Quercus suber]